MAKENPPESDRFETYGAFWPYYLREHRRSDTRLLHFIGTGLGLGIAGWAIWTGEYWYLLAALVSGYLFAWLSHFFLEKNRPATFRYPLWSFASDFRMLACWLTGRLDGELRRAGAKD